MLPKRPKTPTNGCATLELEDAPVDVAAASELLEVLGCVEVVEVFDTSVSEDDAAEVGRVESCEVAAVADTVAANPERGGRVSKIVTAKVEVLLSA